MNLATAYVELRADDAKLQRDLNKVEGDTKKTAASIGKSFAQFFGAVAFGAGIKKSIDAAARLQQAIGATETVFGSASKAVDDFAKVSAKSFGISSAAARELTGNIGSLLKNMGFTQDEAADTSVTLAKLGADLAAAFGGKPDEAVNALASALRGERDPIERYGISLNEAAVKAKAFEMGLYSGKGALDANAKAQATLALITQQSADVQGQFTREIGTAAGAAAVSAAVAEDSAASLGDSFLPIYTRVVQVVTAVAKAFGTLPAPIQVALVAMVGLVALSGPLGTLKTMVVGLSTAYKGLGEDAKATATGVGVFAAVTMVAFTLRSRQATKAAEELSDAIERMGEGTDEAALEGFNQAIASMVVHGTGGGDALAYLAEQSLEAMKRIFDLKAATGAPIEELQLLAKAIYTEEKARAQATRTTEEYGDALPPVTSEIDDQADSVNDLETAFADLLGTLDVNDAYRGALDSIDELREAWVAAWAEGQTPEEAKQSLRDYEQQLDDTKRDVITFGDTLDGVADKERIAEILTMLDEGDLVAAQAAIDKLTAERELRVKVRVSGNAGVIKAAGLGEIEAYADGGIVEHATIMAGEAGREVVLPLTRPSRLAEILRDDRVGGPVAAAMGGAGGGGGGGGIVVNGGIVVGSAQDYARLRDEFDRLLWRVAA